MGRRPLNRLELRAQVEASEKRLEARKSPLAREAANRKAEEERDPPPPGTRMKVVWSVCDAGGRVVMKFPYPQKGVAEALAVKLKAEGRGVHFVRADKEPMI